MHTAVLLDVAKRPVRPAMLWCDTRTTAECAGHPRRARRRGPAPRRGQPRARGFTLPKLLWLRAHEPDAYALVDTVLMPKDWVGWLLTGEIGADVSDASGTLAFDPGARRWSDEVASPPSTSPLRSGPPWATRPRSSATSRRRWRASPACPPASP